MTDLWIDCDEEELDIGRLARCAGEGIESDAALSCEIVFTDREGIRALNAKERGKDAVTDVLSFPSMELAPGAPLRRAEHPFDLDEEGKLFLGSIVICREQAREQAKDYGHSFRREIHYLAVHGLCHLLGYDHETEEDCAAMRAREEGILAAMGIGRNAQ